MQAQIDLYNTNKFVVIPLRSNSKAPYIEKWPDIKKSMEIPVGNNVGVIAGKRSNITVLDIDKQDDGLKYWKHILKYNDKFVTPIVKTPNGGLHIYFKYNKKLKSSIKLQLGEHKIGWDVLNDGKQVVLPPSVIDKKKYSWVYKLDEHPIIPMPLWLERYILDHQV